MPRANIIVTHHHRIVSWSLNHKTYCLIRCRSSSVLIVMTASFSFFLRWILPLLVHRYFRELALTGCWTCCWMICEPAWTGCWMIPIQIAFFFLKHDMQNCCFVTLTCYTEFLLSHFNINDMWCFKPVCCFQCCFVLVYRLALLCS